jgi:hypothetical protein
MTEVATSYPTYNPHLEVAPSLLAGANRGLFTKVDIPSGKFIDMYAGLICESPQEQRALHQDADAEKRERMDRYTYAEDKISIIACEPWHCYARWANDASLQGRFCNAVFDSFIPAKDEHTKEYFPNLVLPEEQRRSPICIRAICDIAAGDEIYVNYGPDYWITKDDRVLKETLKPQKRKYRRIVKRIKSKLEHRRRYLCKKRKKDVSVDDEDVKVPVWPVPSPKENNSDKDKYVMAKWSKRSCNTLPGRENGILDYDSNHNSFLVLSDKFETVHPQRSRFAFSECVLPVS